MLDFLCALSAVAGGSIIEALVGVFQQEQFTPVSQASGWFGGVKHSNPPWRLLLSHLGLICGLSVPLPVAGD